MKTDLWRALLDRRELPGLVGPARRLALREVAIEEGWDDVGGTVRTLSERIDGYGPLTELMGLDDVTDVMVNGPDEVWIERAGRLELTSVSFCDVGALEELIERLLGRAGTRADPARPISDARLPDGARIHVVHRDLAPDGPLVSIRRHVREPISLSELVERGSLSPASASSLDDLVERRASIVVCGPTGSGKTTLLGALLSAVDPDQRIVSVEEIPELRASHPHLVSLVCRPANIEGRGEIDLERLGLAALRMRPDRIVIGEVRSGEARVALRALTSGHRGSMFSIHSRSAAEALERFIDLCADGSTPETNIRRAVASSIDAVVVLDRIEGRRVVREIVTR